ncbi:MAG: alpha-E domain-containing protein [Gammaproteobacteria bacterium]
MLSRVAERLYWLGRYVERAENTARLVAVNNNLMLDLPRSAEHVWDALLGILATGGAFRARYSAVSERNVIRWLIADAENAGSLVSSLRAARENARTVREVMPSESWELINDLHWSAQEGAEAALARKSRPGYLDQIVLKSQQFAGMLQNSMSHREPFLFIQLGVMLERMDMTSRIVDVGAASAQKRADTALAAYENILWMNVLMSLSAYQMYRQQVRERVNGQDVVHFLLHDNAFPHAIAFCIDALEHALARLPRSRPPLQANRRLLQKLLRAQPDTPSGTELHAFIDELQVEFGAVHAAIVATWFASFS